MMSPFEKTVLPVATLVVAMLSDANAAQPPADLTDGVGVGDTVCTAGYVMDTFCINLGVLLDNQEVETLANPELHSVHCLIDVDLCYETRFNILVDPTSGETGYSPGWQVSDNEPLMELGRRVGATPHCATCTGEGGLEMGLRAEVTGTVTSLDPPELEIQQVQVLEEGETGCVEMNIDDGDTADDGSSMIDDGDTADDGSSMSGAFALDGVEMNTDDGDTADDGSSMIDDGDTADDGSSTSGAFALDGAVSITGVAVVGLVGALL